MCRSVFHDTMALLGMGPGFIELASEGELPQPLLFGLFSSRLSVSAAHAPSPESSSFFPTSRRSRCSGHLVRSCMIARLG